MSGPRATPGQLRALIEAAQWVGVSAADLAETMVTVTGAEDPEELTPDGWADLMDRFVVCGFRHPLVPMVTAVQLAALDEARRQVGLDGRTLNTALREVMGLRSRRRLDGLGFARTMEWLTKLGARVPLPGHGFMARHLVGMVHAAAYQQRFSAEDLREMLVSIGGVLRASQLDRRGFLRVMLTFHRLGAPDVARAPRVSADPGMVTQGQANLLWRLWLDVDGWKGDTSPAALDAAIGSMLGLGGGLATLTRAGAAEVIAATI